MTNRERVLAALRGEAHGRVPFTVYECFARPSTAERKLREKGMCVVYRRASWKSHYENVDIRAVTYTEKEQRLTRTEYVTPAGTLSRLTRAGENTVWTLEYPFKSEDDYPALQYLFEHEVAQPDYDAAARVAKELGEDYLVRDGMPLEPLQKLISGGFLDPQTYALEWYDHRDEILKLYEAAAKFNRSVYPLVANGPFETANYGGNVVPQIIGRKVFSEMYMPHYAEAAGILHEKGKLLGCHFDADNTPIMDLIADTALDYIEAYDPGVSPELPEALSRFAGKALWINWPSAHHLDDFTAIRERTAQMVREAKDYPRFLIGVTEDVPLDRWQRVFEAIQEGTEGENA